METIELFSLQIMDSLLSFALSVPLPSRAAQHLLFGYGHVCLRYTLPSIRGYPSRQMTGVSVIVRQQVGHRGGVLTIQYRRWNPAITRQKEVGRVVSCCR